MARRHLASLWRLTWSAATAATTCACRVLSAGHRIPADGLFLTILCLTILFPGSAFAAQGGVALGDLLTVAALIFGLLGIVWGVRERRTRLETLAESRVAEEVADERLAEAQTILQADGERLFVFDGDRLILGEAGGTRAIDGVAAVEAVIHRGDITRVRPLVRDLLKDGRSFSITARPANDGGERIRINGQTAGPFALLRVRDVTSELVEIARIGALLTDAETERNALAESLDLAPVAAWRRDERLMITWVNAAYAMVVDADGVDEAVRDQREIVGSDGREQRLGAREIAEQAHSDGEARAASLSIVTAGARRQMEVVEIPLGRERGTVGFAIDRTAEYEARVEMRQHIRAHADTLDGLPVAVAIFGADRRLNFYNDAFAKLWQLDAAWLDTSPNHGDIIEQLRQRRRLPEQADFRAWKQSRLDLYTHLLEPEEELWHLPDGRMVRMTVRPHPLGGLVFVQDDVTDLLTLERSYKALAGVHATTIDALDEAVAVFGADGTLQLSNPAFARLWGLSAEDLVHGTAIGDVVAACGRRHPDAALWDALHGAVTALPSERRDVATRLKRPDGRVIELATTPLPDGATLVTFVDVTDSAMIEQALVERNEALVAADRLKQDFLSHISYELRTPLNSIIGFAELLQDPRFGALTDRQREYLNDILTSSNQLLSLINNILDLVTLQAEGDRLELGAVKAGRLLDGVAALVRQRAEDTGIRLVVTRSPADAVLHGDEARVRQALFNVVTNAIKYTGAGGTVRLSSAVEGDMVALVVEDSGIGMKPDLAQRVFRDFETRGSIDGMRRAADGAGIGLSLVKRIVDLHHGTVAIDSTPNAGTKVTLRLPLARPLGRRAAS